MNATPADCSGSAGPLDGGHSSSLDTPETVPEDEDPQAVLDALGAEAALEAGVTDAREYGRLGRPFDRRSPFYMGLLGALGVAVAAALSWLVIAAGHMLILLGLAFFVAVGLDPAVTWLARRAMPRWAAVIVVLVVVLGVVAAVLALAIPVLITQTTQLAAALPRDLRSLGNPRSPLGGLNHRYHVISRLQGALTSRSSTVASGVVTVGTAIIGALSSMVIVLVLALYLLADMPRVKRALYQLAPRTRRARMVLLTDEVLSRVGGYVLGNVLISLISGLGTWAWAELFGIPYGLLLGMLVALLDLVPIVGSSIGGLIVALVALSVSVPIAIATATFYVVYRLLEDYVLTPRIMGRTVEVPGLVTVVAVLIGGTLLGVIGALVAIPVAAAIKLLGQEVAAPRLERL